MERTKSVIIVNADHTPAFAVRIEPGKGCHAGDALDHRAVDTAVHDARQLQQLGPDVELRSGPVGTQFGELQTQLAVERHGDIQRSG